jgi:hypothetical protein
MEKATDNESILPPIFDSSSLAGGVSDFCWTFDINVVMALKALWSSEGTISAGDWNGH